jgi:hypothetical protein
MKKQAKQWLRMMYPITFEKMGHSEIYRWERGPWSACIYQVLIRDHRWSYIVKHGSLMLRWENETSRGRAMRAARRRLYQEMEIAFRKGKAL